MNTLKTKNGLSRATFMFVVLIFILGSCSKWSANRNVESVTFQDVSSLTLIEGSSKYLCAKVLPDNISGFGGGWTSSDVDVAIAKSGNDGLIDYAEKPENGVILGKITAVKAGIAIITVRAGNKTASIVVTVVANPD